jgi:hypothetical protein
MGLLRLARVYALTGEDLEMGLASIDSRLTSIEAALTDLPTQTSLDSIVADQDALVGYVGGIATSQSDTESLLNTWDTAGVPLGDDCIDVIVEIHDMIWTMLDHGADEDTWDGGVLL